MNGNQELAKLKDRLVRDEAKRDVLLSDLERARVGFSEKVEKLENIKKARAVIQRVAKDTQSTLEFHVGRIVSIALASIWDDPYEFQLEFVTRRNQPETDLWLIKNDEKIKPVEASGFLFTGGGVIDVVAFALRCAFWSLKRSRPVMILDEPFKYVSVDLQSKCSAMLKRISQKLGLQIIMVSHLPEIIESADRIIKIEKVGEISSVKEVIESGAMAQIRQPRLRLRRGARRNGQGQEV